MKSPAAFGDVVSGLRPLYQTENKMYRADTCQPVVDAVQAQLIGYEALTRGYYPGRRLRRNSLVGVSLVGYWDAKRDQNWGLDWHRNEGLELTLLQSGSLTYACDNLEYQLDPGDLTIARPWQPHRVGNPNIAASRLHFLIIDAGVRRPHQAWNWPSWVSLTDDDRKELTQYIRYTKNAVWRGTQQVRRCFEHVGRTIELDRSGDHISILTVQLNELLVRLLEMFRCKEIRLDESLSTTQRTVELFWLDVASQVDHLAEPWTVRKMARRCGISVSQFIQLSKRLYNRTPMKQLNRLRVDQAAKLLADEPDQTVTEVATKLGFSSSQYFATVFLREKGCSPSAFRVSRDA